MMKTNYALQITFSSDDTFNLDYINSICSQYRGSMVLVEVPNTKGITSSMLEALPANADIRIAGGYDVKRVADKKGIVYKNGETGEYYIDAVIYTKNEAVKIVREMEKIEAMLEPEWSDIQKLVCIYDYLKTNIMYDPKFESKPSSETRSLRGLITKESVCAGYSIILKELLERINISCEYVEGGTRNLDHLNHAWNIVKIGGKKYPIDLTWDNARFSRGSLKTFDLLGQNVTEFCRTHHPSKDEITQNYEHSLSELDQQLIKKIYAKLNITREYEKATTYYGVRSDNSEFIAIQVGDATIGNKTYYRYYYCEKSKDGTYQAPLVLCSDTNLTNIINCKNFNKPIPDNYEWTVSNVLFSKENIASSLGQNTCYIGGVRKRELKNGLNLVLSTADIDKPQEVRRLFSYPTRRFTRQDGTTIIVQQMLRSPYSIDGIDVMKYDVFEMFNQDGKPLIKKNTIFTEKSLFRNAHEDLADTVLSRDMLDKMSRRTGGYIGYYSEDDSIKYNPNLSSYFENTKRIDLDIDKEEASPLPTFKEVKDLAANYEVSLDSDSIQVRSIATGEVIVDPSLAKRALFANIWLSSAGIIYYLDDKRPGEKYAFNSQAEELYNTICTDLRTSAELNGRIDTVGLFEDIKDQNNYKYSNEIVVNLFRSKYQTDFINEFVLASTGATPTTKAEPLYNLSHAASLTTSKSEKNV